MFTPLLLSLATTTLVHADKMRFAALLLTLSGLVASNPTLPETPDTFKSSTTTNQASMSIMSSALALKDNSMNAKI